MKAFLYNGDAYVRCIPSKHLFRSTMVHEVVNRGDVFALRIKDQMLTIVPGTADVTHFEATAFVAATPDESDPQANTPA